MWVTQEAQSTSTWELKGRALLMSYAERSREVRRLGFSTYKAYLQSDLWKTIRRRVLQRNGDCRRCGVVATQVHHASYDRKTMTGETINSLIPCCSRCHRTAERHARGLQQYDRIQAVTDYLKQRVVNVRAVKASRKTQTRRLRMAGTWKTRQARERARISRHNARLQEQLMPRLVKP